MKYYLSAVSNTYASLESMKKTGGTGQILVSYAQVKNVDSVIKLLNNFKDSEVIIDSGAFTAWNIGKPVKREDLLVYYKKLQQYRDDLHFINLDVIPGSKGHKPTFSQAEAACAEGWENYLWFKKNGVEVLPVFHEDDEWDYLHMMMEHTNYIAISPANDSSKQRRMVWLDRVYKILRADYKTHGLAATSKELLQRYPFYSVDSINWKSAHMFGRSSSRAYGQDQTASLARDNKTLYHIFVQDINFHKHLQKEITDLWARRGVVWKD